MREYAYTTRESRLLLCARVRVKCARTRTRIRSRTMAMASIYVHYVPKIEAYRFSLSLL